jgi:hypothetical protein
MTFRQCFTKELLSVRSKFLYLFVLLYLIVYLLGELHVVMAFSGRFFAPAALLFYAVAASFLSAYFESAVNRREPAERFRVIRNAATGELSLPLSEISSGDEVILKKGDRIPFSGDVVGGHGEVLYSRVISEKYPKKGHTAPDSRIRAGSVMLSGDLIVEVTEVTKKPFNDKFPGEDRREKKSPKELLKNPWQIVRYSAVFLAVLMFVIRFFIGNQLAFGTYESILDNAALSLCLFSFCGPFGKTDGFISAAFAKLRGLRIRGDALKFAEADVIAADSKLFYLPAEPTFYALKSENGEDAAAVVTGAYSTLETVPEPIRSLLSVNIKTLTESRYGGTDNSDDAGALRRFCGESSTLPETVMLSCISPDSNRRYSAATVRAGGVTATEYCGEAQNFSSVYLYDETTGRKLLTDSAKDKLFGSLAALQAEGKRIRMAAVNRARIVKDVLPKEDWLILGYFVFPAVPTFAIKQAVNKTADEGIKVSLLPSVESPGYADYLVKSLRLFEGASDGAVNGESVISVHDGVSAAVVTDVTALRAGLESDFCIAPRCADVGTAAAAAVVTDTENPADAFLDAAGAIMLLRRLRLANRVFLLLAGFILLAAFVFFTFILSPLPVAFGDDIIPFIMFFSLLISIIITYCLKIV